MDQDQFFQTKIQIWSLRLLRMEGMAFLLHKLEQHSLPMIDTNLL